MIERARILLGLVAISAAARAPLRPGARAWLILRAGALAVRRSVRSLEWMAEARR